MNSTRINKSYIKAFYSNLYMKKGPRGIELRTHVNGQDLHLTQEVIYKITELPMTSLYKFPHFDEDEFLPTIGIPDKCDY